MKRYVVTVVRSVIGSENISIVCECRHCGTNVDTRTHECPTCEKGGIARYEL